MHGFQHIKCILSIDAMKIDEDLYIDHRGVIEGVINRNLIHVSEDIRGNYLLYSKLFDDQLKR